MEIERPIPDLSPREQQLLKFAAEGLTDTAIAHKLGISEATVGTYWGRVRIKLGPFSRTELVATVLRAEREVAVETLRKENEHLVEELRSQGAVGGESHFRTLLEHAPDAIVLVGSGGAIEYANLAALELFAYSGDDLIGRDILCLVPPRFRTGHIEHLAEFVRNPQRRQMGAHLETPALKGDGTEFEIRAALSAIDSPTGMIVICVIRPVVAA